jgi:hypothetical protein
VHANGVPHSGGNAREGKPGQSKHGAQTTGGPRRPQFPHQSGKDGGQQQAGSICADNYPCRWVLDEGQRGAGEAGQGRAGDVLMVGGTTTRDPDWVFRPDLERKH